MEVGMKGGKRHGRTDTMSRHAGERKVGMKQQKESFKNKVRRNRVLNSTYSSDREPSVGLIDSFAIIHKGGDVRRGAKW